MRTRVYAILALSLFLLGLALLAFSLLTHRNGFVVYVAALCAPGAFMALMSTLERNRARRDAAQNSEDGKDDSDAT